MVVLFALRGIGDFVANYYPSWVGRQVIKSLRRDVFSHYLRLPTAFLDRQQSGHLLSKLTYNIEMVADAATGASISLIGDSITIVGLISYLFYLNWRLALFCILAAPVIGWLMQVANRSFRRYSERIQSSMGDITRVAKEAIDANRLIKIFNAEDHQEERFEAVSEHNRASQMRLARAKSVSNPVVQIIASMALAGVLFVAIRQIFAHNMRVDELFGFLTALMLVPGPLRSLVNVGGPLQQGVAAGQSVFELLDEPTEGGGGTRTHRAGARRHRIPQRVASCTAATRVRCCTTSPFTSSRARPSRSSAARAAGRPRWWASCRASTTSRREPCSSTGWTSASTGSRIFARR